jgi:antagonist of KipI
VSIRVFTSGMLTTIQDLGRYGYAHLGISPSGAADSLALRIANRIVGNPENAPALEMTLVSATLEFDSSATISLAGAAIQSGSQRLSPYEPLEIKPGFTLHGGPLIEGARCYLAIRGGFNIPRVMASASTHLAARFGGFKGRALKPGDELECDTLPCTSVRPASTHIRELFQQARRIRVTPGLQWDWFDLEMTHRFLSSQFEVSELSDRSGLRLTGPEIRAHQNSELLTEGVPLGAIQVPPNAQPIILFVDQQTTGGYPKIANVATVDLHRIGQLRPRDKIGFELISVETALAQLRHQERIITEAFPC